MHGTCKIMICVRNLTQCTYTQRTLAQAATCLIIQAIEGKKDKGAKVIDVTKKKDTKYSLSLIAQGLYHCALQSSIDLDLVHSTAKGMHWLHASRIC